MGETYGRIARAQSWQRAGARWAVAWLVLCGLMLVGCGPSFDPMAKADVDERLAAVQDASKTVPAPPGFDPMPLATGQWVQYKMIDEQGRPSFLTYKVLGQQGDAYWIETLDETYFGRTGQKMLIAFGSRTDPNLIQVRALVLLDRRGNVTHVPPERIPVMRVSFRSIASALAITWQGMPQEAETVPAGRFEGCYRIRADAQWGPWRSLADSWRHPAVPLSGLVRSQGVDRPFTMDLVAFGTTGATADF